MKVRFDGPGLLVGETSDWRNAVALPCSMDLGPGVYQYKRVVADAWELDAENPRTRSEGGRRNSVLVVGGAPEPWLFAPAEPWVTRLARGGVRVLVGVRKAGAREVTNVRVVLREDAAVRVVAARAFEEDEHVFFTATLPASSKHAAIAIEADGVPSFEAAIAPPPRAPPSWWKSATIYGVFVDRFRPAVDREGWERDPGKRVAAGGHLEGIRRSLGELAELGVDTLYLTPVHVGASVHRYDVVDPLTVDPALGGEAAYDALVADARARGMRIVQDVSFAHAGRGFPAFEEVLREGRAARRAGFFQWKGDALAHYGRRTDAPLFDLENEEMQALVLEAVAYWARRGAKGLRLDMTAEVPLALGRRIRKRFAELVPDGVVFGEVVPLHAWRWRNEGVVDAATDFEFHRIVTELVTDPRASAADAWEKLARAELLRGGDARLASVRFLSTHDHPRLATLGAVRGGLTRLALAYTMLATMPGVPMLLYGEEHGMRSDGAGLELEDVWPDRAPMPWAHDKRDPLLRAIVASLFHARRDSIALREGSLRLLFADATTLVYRREADGDVVDVALNFATEAKVIALEDDELPRLVPVAHTGGVVTDGANVTLPPNAAIVARRERVHTVRARRNLAIRDREFADAREFVESRPTRFFFSVTERCNLRCAHCITHAPERTASGVARTMTPAVLDALRDDFALGEYFAFVHGGESLTAPIFWTALDAIRVARGGEPYVAHLLTNGVLFGP
ncbi:MAG TPA: alpha-amylase family glycosyl hydrolase, partial [Labilithrix sp.]